MGGANRHLFSGQRRSTELQSAVHAPASREEASGDEAARGPLCWCCTSDSPAHTSIFANTLLSFFEDEL